MNERIRELADKIWAEEYCDNPATDKLLPAQLNKFAQLIIQECIDIISPYTVSMSRPGEEYLHPILEIKEHFGVEE
jgi:hypothetical protein